MFNENFPMHVLIVSCRTKIMKIPLSTGNAITIHHRINTR